MSLLSTAPETNPTILETHPTQVMRVKPSVEIIDFTFDDISTVVDTKTFQIEQLDWLKLSQKNKFIQFYTWPIDVSTTWMTIDFNRAFIDQLMPVGQAFNSFSKFTKVLISIKPTSNSLMQGLSVISYQPVPVGNFLNVAYNYNLTANPERIFQIPGKKFVSPNNSNELNFLVPINFPFEFFRWSAGSGGTPSDFQENYIGSYQFGTLTIQNLIPLTTKSALTGLVYSVSAQVIDLQTAGLNFGV